MKKLGFGCMRLPLLENGDVDTAQFSRMVDLCMEKGFTYFDTAHGYLEGKSELAVKECLTSRYPRERYTLTDKLTVTFFKEEKDVRPNIEMELEACGVTYFDYVLLHSMNARFYEKHKACRTFEIMQEMKREGKIRHVGLSFHDTPEVLDQILTEHPEMEIVQIQYNYLDLENPAVQSRACYEVCRKHRKPILIMEPVKGGSLANLPPEAGTCLDALHGGSHASFAIRFAASQEGVFKVLSGMSNLEQVRDNLSYMENFQPITETERQAIDRVRDIMLQQQTIGCTACRYCVDGCPQGIPIPDIFKMYNQRKQYLDAGWDYEDLKVPASRCIGCGQCEEVCPQHLPIRQYLKESAKMFE